MSGNDCFPEVYKAQNHIIALYLKYAFIQVVVIKLAEGTVHGER